MYRTGDRVSDPTPRVRGARLEVKVAATVDLDGSRRAARSADAAVVIRMAVVALSIAC